MKKDDIIELTIEDLGIDGEGIGKADGMAIFVKDAVVGDWIRAKIMKMKKNYGYARLLEVLEPSPVRCTPRCEFARQCGGCQLQAMTYEAQLDFKAKKVWNHLTRIGGLTDLAVPEIIGMEDPWRYRNKAQFPFGTDKEAIAEMKDHYQRGGLGDVKVKRYLNEVLEAELAPIRARRAEFEKDIPAVYEMLRKGSEAARAVAAQTLKEVRDKIGINYFDNI